MSVSDTKSDAVQRLIRSLTEIRDCEESLLSYAHNVVRDPNGVDEFVSSKVGKLFGLASVYKRVLERHNLKTKSELEKLLQRNFRHMEIQDLVDEVHQLEKDWDVFLEGIDKSLDKDDGHIGQMDEDGPLDVELTNAITDSLVTLQQLQEAEKDVESLEGRVMIISFGCKEGAVKWLEETKCKYPMLLDTERRVWSINSLMYYAEKMAQGVTLPKPYEDMHDDPHQMGGDFIVNKHGTIKYLYPSKTARDRPSVDQLCEVLKNLK